MPTFDNGDVSLHYEERGSGFPLLLIAPGGMLSSVGFWTSTPWNPVEHLAGDYRVIAMDQRNAGRSTGPISATDGWHTYRDDQLALLDHLGVDRFHVAGMCIGGPYIMGLIEAAPQRVASGVVFQTIGLVDGNREAFYEMFDSWANDLKELRPEVSEADWSSFRENMYGGENFLFNVDDEFVATVPTPLLVLLGRDLYHPEASSRDLARLAPNATLVEDWIPSEHHARAKDAVAAFLAEHTP